MKGPIQVAALALDLAIVMAAACATASAGEVARAAGVGSDALATPSQQGASPTAQFSPEAAHAADPGALAGHLVTHCSVRPLWSPPDGAGPPASIEIPPVRGEFALEASPARTAPGRQLWTPAGRAPPIPDQSIGPLGPNSAPIPSTCQFSRSLASRSPPA